MANLFIILDEFEQTVNPPTADAYTRTAYNVITSDASNVILAVAIAVESSVKGAINIGDKWYGLTTSSPTYHPTIGQAYASYCKKQIINPNKDILSCVALEEILNAQVAKKVELSEEFDLDKWIGEEEEE